MPLTCACGVGVAIVAVLCVVAAGTDLTRGLAANRPVPNNPAVFFRGAGFVRGATATALTGVAGAGAAFTTRVVGVSDVLASCDAFKDGLFLELQNTFLDRFTRGTQVMRVP